MPRIKKDKPKLHILIPDTNALWHEDKAFAVSPQFDEMCQECRGLLDLELVIPSAVYGELHFQQTTSAVKALDRANQAFTEISTISATHYSHRVTSMKIREKVKAKLDKWIADNRVHIAPVPTKEMEWDAIIERAIWREPPFTFDPKDKVNEKGFRDALILETLKNLCKTEQRDVVIVFLSSDWLLRSTAQQSLKADSRCLFFESIDAFKSYVKLTGEELTQKFIGKLLSRATEKFYKKDDVTCLYTRESVLAKLREKFKDFFDNPQRAGSTLPLSLSLSKWRLVGPQKIIIEGARFVSLKPSSIYNWANQLVYVCIYGPETSGFSFQSSPTSTENVLVLAFLITWHAFVKADGRFHDVTLDDLSMLTSTFTDATAELRRRYGLTSGET